MEWLDTVNKRILAAEAICEGMDGTRDALFGMWLALGELPENVLDLYAEILESDLSAGATEMELAAVFAELETPQNERQGTLDIVTSMALRVRALENLLYSMNDGSPVRRSEDVLANFENKQAYLLLRAPATRTPKDRQPFRLRGLARSRILPVKLGSFRVELQFPSDPRGRLRLSDGLSLKFGGGLFKGIEFHIENQPEGFVVRSAKVPDQANTIQAQIQTASDESCSCLVYPELTIDAPVLDEVRASMVEQRLDAGSLSIIVAGSMHREIEGRRYNVATILDGYGNPVAEQKKLYRYIEAPHPSEAIDLGDTLNIVVLEDAVLAFGICLDFCNPRTDPPFLKLDVDYVLVPSCGEDKTMLHHIQRSTEVLRNVRGRTFVVQQYHRDKPPEQHPLGYVLARHDVEPPTLEQVSTDQVWNTVIF